MDHKNVVSNDMTRLKLSCAEKTAKLLTLEALAHHSDETGVTSFSHLTLSFRVTYALHHT